MKNWLTGHTALNHLRRWEADLDSFHEQYELFHYEPTHATFATLAAIDMAFTGSMIDAAERSQDLLGTDAALATQRTQQEGFAQIFRWLCAKNGQLDAKVTHDPAIFRSVYDLLQHAQCYTDIADFHRMLNRGDCELEVQAEPPTCRFVPVRPTGSLCPSMGMHEDFLDLMRRKSQLLGSGRVKVTTAWVQAVVDQSRIMVQSNSLVVTNPRAFANLDFQQSISRIVPQEEIACNKTTDCGGFTMEQFDRCWMVLLLWSTAVWFVFSRVARRVFPSVPAMAVQRVDRISLHALLAECAGVSESIAENVCSRLSFASETHNPDIQLTPLLQSEGMYLWSPGLIIMLRHQRNMLRLMARMPATKALADNAIGSREPAMISRVERKLQKYGFRTVTLRRWKSEDAEGEIDLLAWREAEDDGAIIIEAKACLRPDEINEVDALTQSADKAAAQLATSIAALKSNSQSEHRFVPEMPALLTSKLRPIVLFLEGSPSNRYTHSDVPAVNLRGFLDRFRSSDFRSAERLWEAAKEKRWLPKVSPASTQWLDVKVGKVTYKLPYRLA